jgi:ADP-heptose:LPS heptosyltransferase
VLPTRGWDEHAVEYYARSVASLIEGPIASGVIDIAGPALAEAAELVLDGAVCVAPGARYEFKQWPQERYVRLIRRLAASGIPTILVGHSFDAEIVARIRSATGAPAVIVDDDYRRAAVLRAAGVVVANNSGMAHLAQVAGARVVCVHSHTSPVMWRPWGDGHVNLVGRPGPCACPGLTEFELPVPCGKGIEPESVADAVAGLVGQAPVRLVAEGAGR